LEATQALILDVADNAVAAAIRDYRFPKVALSELASIQIAISVLSPTQCLDVATEDELVAFLTQNRCGVVLHYHHRKATFLPSVWQSLTTPKVFLSQLKRKAGLDETFWSNEFRFEIYQAYEILE
jgi:hypothetical protein